MEIEERKKLRRENRYLIRRIKTELEGGVKAPDLPEGFKESFENQPKFRGWTNYQVTWDVYEDDPWSIEMLSESAEEAWNKLLLEKVPELPEELRNGSESYLRPTNKDNSD